jgi:DUF4097 and DUF4098 domain-containing protein YvlB
MKALKINALIFFFIAAGWLFAAAGYAGGETELHKTFKNKTLVEITTINGDCAVKKNGGGDIEVFYVQPHPGSSSKPQFIEEGTTLIIKDQFNFSGSGSATWNISVPEKMDIRFNSVSGDFSAAGLKGSLHARTVSGDIKARDCRGEVDLKSVSGNMDIEDLSGEVSVKSVSSDLKVRKLSGKIQVKTTSGDIDAVQLDGSVTLKVPSGDIEIKDSRGSFAVKTASGDIDATGIVFTGPGNFKVASGDIYIRLAQSTEHDLNLKAASGDVVLNYNGNPIKGYFEFKAIADRGQIISPFPFDNEEEEERWGKKYEIKSFKRSSGSPRVYLHTAGGKAVLQEK